MNLDDDEFIELEQYSLLEVEDMLKIKNLRMLKPLLRYNTYYLIIMIINKKRVYLRILSITGILYINHYTN